MATNTEIADAASEALNRLAGALKDVTEIKVQTKYVEVVEGQTLTFDNAQAIAETKIDLNGDWSAIVPMRRTGDNVRTIDLDPNLLALHERNVQAAIAYRNAVLNTLLQAVQSLRG